MEAQIPRTHIEISAIVIFKFQNRRQTERCLGLLTSLCRLASELQVHQGSVSQKIRWAVIEEDIQHLLLAYTDIDTQTHTETHADIDTPDTRAHTTHIQRYIKNKGAIWSSDAEVVPAPRVFWQINGFYISRLLSHRRFLETPRT